MSKIVIFYQPYFLNGGSERTNIILAKNLVENKKEVYFASVIIENVFMREAMEYGIKFIKLESIGALKGILELQIFIKKLLINHEVTLVCCQSFANAHLWIIKLLSKKNTKFKIVASERNHPVELIYTLSLKKILILPFLYLSYLCSDKIISNSLETSLFLSGLLKKEVIHINNPTINERLIKNYNLLFCNKKNFENKKIIVSVGRLEKQKNYETLLKAIHLIEDNNIILKIVGDGSELNKLKYLAKNLNISNRVEFIGFDSNPYKYIIEANVFVLSSLYEGLPNSLIEAAYFGIPCVSTNCKSGPKEILLNGTAGYLSPIKDSYALAENIVKALNDKETNKKMLINFKKNEHNFYEENVAALFNKFIDEV